MAMELVDVEQVRTGRGGRGTGSGKYGKYLVAITPHVVQLKNGIAKSKDGMIRVKVAEIGKAMGKDFENKNPTSMYWGLKSVLFETGIVINNGTHVDGDKLLVMRARTEGDVLPASLVKSRKETKEKENVEIAVANNVIVNEDLDDNISSEELELP